ARDHRRHLDPAARPGRRARRRRAPRAAGDDRAAGLRGGGLPGAPGLRRAADQGARPVHHDGPDGRGGVRARRAQGHLVAPAPRVRDRHVHHGRRVPAPGQPRRRRAHPGRRDAVDDRGRRDPAHRDAAGRARRGGRGVPRDPAVGQPARPREDDRAGVPEPRGHRQRAARLRGRRLAAAPHRRRPGRQPRPGRDPDADHDAARQRLARRAAVAAVGPAVQRAGLRPVRHRHGRHRAGAHRDRSDGGVRPWRPHHGGGRRGAGQPAPRPRARRARRGADPGAGRAVRPVRHEQPGAAAAGGGRLPVGPVRADPARRADAAHGPL
ncbi:MAG: Pirin, partial [uncultured Frankineae bacterium]